MKLSEQFTEFIEKLSNDGVDTVSLDFLRKRVPDILKLEAKVARNRGYATFYRDKGLRITRDNRNLEAVADRVPDLENEIKLLRRGVKIATELWEFDKEEFKEQQIEMADHTRKLEAVAEKATEAEKLLDVMAIDGIKHWLSPGLLELYPEIHTALRDTLADLETQHEQTENEDPPPLPEPPEPSVAIKGTR